MTAETNFLIWRDCGPDASSPLHLTCTGQLVACVYLLRRELGNSSTKG
jgi:hypothetical protein